MKSFPDGNPDRTPPAPAPIRSRIGTRRAALISTAALTAAWALGSVAWQARAALPRWMQDAVSGSAIEAALYRAMQIPGVSILYPRPPKEAQGEISALIGKSPDQPELYSLRATEAEQALDFRSAEADWKTYVGRARDPVNAKLGLADYYHRRLQAGDEVRVLMEVGSAAAAPREEYIAAANQRSWKAFERLIALAQEQGLPGETTEKAYSAWIARYPQQPTLYARELRWLLDQGGDRQNLNKADGVIEQYRKAFPQDAVFPLKASALVAYKRGSVDKALALYDSGFEPLWPADLVSSYYSLLGQAHQLRRFVSDARNRLAKNPDDLNAMARLFYYAQQQGNLAQAQQSIDAFRLSKDARNAPWTAQELFTLATLAEQTHAYPEASRYDFALYNTKGPLSSGDTPQASGLGGVIRILLTAPDQPMQLGAGNLSMYRDLATVDQGPGYWNGILSLWLNSTSPERAYHDEEQRAQPYFHRAKAAELLAVLDKQYPQASQRPELHKLLVRVCADYGQSTLVIKSGGEFLRDFTAPANEADRVAVAMYMADAYARQRDAKDEFALYDRLLTELGAMTAGMPLTAADASSQAVAAPQAVQAAPDQDGTSSDASGDDNGASQKKIEKSPAFEVDAGSPTGISIAGAQQYRDVLERYLGRLTATGQLQQALALLRHELDRNPNDPLLYERLASFLEHNHLGAQQEEVYQQAIQKFQDPGWYDKLARLYLREKKRQAFASLTKQVTAIFAGTELESYFRQVTHNDAQMYLELNLFAHQRFPHDEVFVRNLLNAYHAKGTYNDAAWAALLREHWSDAEDLRRQFFDYLSSHGRLEAELAQLRTLVPVAGEQAANPAAARELSEAEMWRSHYEASAPLLNALAEAYPSDNEIGTQASSLDRSMAYYDASLTARAVAIEKRLLAYDPSNLDRLARIGDIYADSGADGTRGHEDLAAAAPYWRRMPEVHPGSPEGCLQAATVFWDYFQFDDALAQIRAARDRFHQPNLYGYEAGAIDEGKRDFDGAVREYTAAALAESEGQGAMRLLRLARRKATSKAVDDETAKAVAANSADPAPLALRARVLEVERRSAEIGPMFEAAIARTTTFEQAQEIGSQAQSRSLPKVREMALEKEISLARDPVEKLEISYELMRAYEARNDTEDAARVVDSVYRDNPKLLGVVRNTADFYWRTKQPAKAITTLTEAASASGAAQPALSRQFLVEAADKANQSGSYARARELMDPLIDPARFPDGAYNAQYLAVVADSYARAGDDAPLRKFYIDKLDSLRSAAMPASERREKAVLLRRGLIPALTRMKDYAGAVDQYIAILSAYPEDAGSVQEAALYALRYDRRKQLVDFAAQTVKASPRDSRFFILLAQVQTTFEDYPSAIDAYAHAVAIRADRSDIFAAKAALEERLQRLDDACKDYERLYSLSYQAPQWMVKVASVRARQGRKDDTIKALERAWIEGHPALAPDYFRVATQLESWQMLEDALRFAEQGRKAEGEALLAGPAPGEQSHDDPQGAALYARLMTRLHQPEKALAVLDAAIESTAQSPNSPGVVLDQVQKQGIASVTNEEWRQRYVAEHLQTARQRYRSAVAEMGKAAGAYFAPEEKESFAKLVDARFNQAPWHESDASARLQWIDVAAGAGLSEEEARLRKSILLDSTSSHAEVAGAQLEPYAQLQRSRMEYSELAATAAAYARTLLPEQAIHPLAIAADAYRDAGDEAAELRTLESFSNDTSVRDRILALLLKLQPADFAGYEGTSGGEDALFAAPKYAVAHADLKITRSTLSARAAQQAPPWQPAYSALAGLYFRDVSAETDHAFHAVLADERTIGQRLAESKNAAAAAISGDVWFYYGMRYGVYRALAPQAQWAQLDPEEFLPAELERNASAANYAGLAQAYADAAQTEAALREYRHALELAPDAAAVHDAMALLLWNSQKREEATAQWLEAIAALNRVQNKAAAPETFWTDFAAISRHVGRRGLGAAMHSAMDALLRNYIARNGNYRSDELLHAAFVASGGGSEGAAWLISLSSAAQEPASVLASLSDEPWLSPAAREPILLREVDLASIAAQPGVSSNLPDWRMLQARRSLLQFDVVQGQNAKAEAVLAGFTPQQRDEEDIFIARIVLAARAHKLQPFLDAILQGEPGEPARSADPISARINTLRKGATRLENEGDTAGALAIREFVFTQLELRHNLTTSDYAGLANARLAVNDVPGAVAVLRRLALQGSDSSEAGASDGAATGNDEAARLLETSGHEAEAIEFLTALAKEQPWNAACSLRLARAELHAGRDTESAVRALDSVAASQVASYDLRVEAALLLAGSGHRAADFGSRELALLASGSVSAQQARQPFFATARIAAAGQTDTRSEAPPQARADRAHLLREALAIAPRGIGAGEGYSDADLHLKIFRAEAASENYPTSLAALSPLLQDNSANAYNPDADIETSVPDADTGLGDDAQAQPGNSPIEALQEQLAAGPESLKTLERRVPLPGNSKLSSADKFALALTIADVYEHTGGEAAALPYLKLAAALAGDKSQAADLDRRWRAIQIGLAVELENSSRRPAIRAALDQPAVVKPRITTPEMEAAISSGEAR